jgi:hypothetical protein
MGQTTAFLKRGQTFTPIQAGDNVETKLPPGNFVIKIEPKDGYLFFDTIEDFRIPKKLYGDLKSQAKRILATFEDRKVATGVLLSGDKGSGKTLLAKMLAAECSEKGMPVIVVDRPFGPSEPGEPSKIDEFYKLIQDVQQPAVVVFDEFEKTHTKQQQEAMLTLLDGVFQGRKLFILTCNDQWSVDEHMLNRPGRLFYHLEFLGLSASAIREYCEENLSEGNKKNKYIDQIVQMASFFDSFNFDMVQALVEEMNRFSEDPFEAVQMLNIRPRRGSAKHTVSLVVGGQVVESERIHPSRIEGSPIGREIKIKFYADDTNEDNQPILWKDIWVKPQHLSKADGDAGVYEFKVDDAVVIFTREKEPPFSYREYISV